VVPHRVRRLAHSLKRDIGTAVVSAQGDTAAPIQSLIEKLAMLSEFTEAAIEQAFTNTLNEYGIQMGKLAQPVRVALTGAAVSPGIHDVIAVLGKERTIDRLRKALEYIPQLDSPG